MTQKSNPGVHFIKLIGSLLSLFVFGACSITQPPVPIPSVRPTSSAISPTMTNVSTEITNPTATQGAAVASGMAPVIITPELPIDPSTGWKIYTNSPFGLGIQFPPTWYGPDVNVWDQGVRLEVGSDKVYPYGTDRLDRAYEVKNSYYVVVQYSKNSNNWTLEQYRENQPWIDTYLSLLDLKDGESLSGIRDLVIRVRKIKLERFEGLEYISTLSETAQTEYFYARQIVLLDEHLNTLTMTGTPNNVEIINRDTWRDAYGQVDEENLETFHKILESIAVR